MYILSRNETEKVSQTEKRSRNETVWELPSGDYLNRCDIYIGVFGSVSAKSEVNSEGQLKFEVACRLKQVRTLKF
jgi:hypothetical protein